MSADVHCVVPMAHVADVERSIAFYAHLGFRVQSRREHAGRTVWAWLQSGPAALMLTAASEPVDPRAQAILLYMYSRDVAALRARLLAAGLTDGGTFTGAPLPISSAVFEPTLPDYMPEGEIRVADPDGYCLLIGQGGD